MDRGTIIDNAAAVIDAGGAILKSGTIGKLYAALEQEGADVSGASILSSQEHFDQCRLFIPPGSDSQPMTWNISADLPRDLLRMEAGAAYGVIKNLASARRETGIQQ